MKAEIGDSNFLSSGSDARGSGEAHESGRGTHVGGSEEKSPSLWCLALVLLGGAVGSVCDSLNLLRTSSHIYTKLNDA